MMSGVWKAYVEQDGAWGRIVFLPQGADVGPTFAVRRPGFRPVPLDSAGIAAVCGGRVHVHLRVDGQPPHAANLEIRWESGGRKRSWKPGQLDDENLGGPFLALDNLWRTWVPSGVQPHDPLVGFDESVWNTAFLTWILEVCFREAQGRFPETEERNAELERLIAGQPPTAWPQWPQRLLAARENVRRSPPGFFSRWGITLFRDSTWPWDEERQWIRPHPDPAPIVLYVLHHDGDFKAACRELVRLLGPIPRLPERFLGVWYSNYREMGAADFVQLEADFARHDLPLDLISVDMDWHGKNWYGYDWNSKLFPDPAGFAAWAHGADLRTAFNVHPLYVLPEDSRARQFVAAAGHQGAALGEEGDWHPFQKGCLKIDIHDQRQADAYFHVLHRPVELGGCDAWWIDGSVRRADGGDECSWLNHAYRAHQLREGDMPPIVLSRAGGLGAHRDAIVFTGDTCSQWELLAFEVETVVRSAGSLMAWVSHDIGGFWHDTRERAENKPPDDLYLRWLQFGCLGPIMRLHSFNGVREPWRFAKSTLAVARHFLHLRMRLLPYLVRLRDEAHETGVPPCRPMWFEFDAPEAADCTGQYMLGEALLVAPVVRADGMVRYWLPPGTWHEGGAVRSLDGPRWIEEEIPLTQLPMWLRADCSLELGTAARRTRQVLLGAGRVVHGPGWALEGV